MVISNWVKFYRRWQNKKQVNKEFTELLAFQSKSPGFLHKEMQKAGVPYLWVKGHHLRVPCGFWRTLTGHCVVVPIFILVSGFCYKAGESAPRRLDVSMVSSRT